MTRAEYVAKLILYRTLAMACTTVDARANAVRFLWKEMAVRREWLWQKAEQKLIRDRARREEDPL